MSLELKELSIRTLKQVILANITLKFSSANFTVLMGPSGSGKTTLIKTILGLTNNLKIKGEIYFDNKLIQKDQKIIISPNQRKFAYIPQDLKLWPHLTVVETLMLAAKWAQSFDQNWLQKIILLTGLDAHKNKKPSELSGGEQQRLSLARALIAKPRLIIFDEPLGALDIIAKAHLINIIKQAQRDLNYDALFITHDLIEAFALASHIALIYGHEIFWHGPKHELLDSCFPKDWQLLKAFEEGVGDVLI